MEPAGHQPGPMTGASGPFRRGAMPAHLHRLFRSRWHAGQICSGTGGQRQLRRPVHQLARRLNSPPAMWASGCLPGWQDHPISLRRDPSGGPFRAVPCRERHPRGYGAGGR